MATIWRTASDRDDQVSNTIKIELFWIKFIYIFGYFLSEAIYTIEHWAQSIELYGIVPLLALVAMALVVSSALKIFGISSGCWMLWIFLNAQQQILCENDLFEMRMIVEKSAFAMYFLFLIIN